MASSPRCPRASMPRRCKWPGRHFPRTYAGLLMSMSGSGLSLARIARPRPGKAWPLATVSLAFLPALRPIRSRARSKLFLKKVSSKNFYARFARLRDGFCAVPPSSPPARANGTRTWGTETVVWALFKGGLNGAPGELRGQGAGLLQGASFKRPPSSAEANRSRCRGKSPRCGR